MEKEDCDKMRFDLIKKHDIQLKALNQNLANLRLDLKQLNDKFAQSEFNLNTVKGNNLELEAKLSNCIEERNQLLARCIEAEKNWSMYKNHNLELKVKLDDTQYALQEIGREHQTLQVRE